MFNQLYLTTICLALITGCSLTQALAGETSDKHLDVSVTYRERIMVPPESQLEVTLADVSRMDAAAETISTVPHTVTAGPPYNVSLAYNEDQILPSHRYSLKAKITNGDKLMFISTSSVDPFATDKRPVEIITEKVSSNPVKPNATLDNTHWRLLVVKGKEVTLSEGQKEPFLLIEASNDRVRGFSGCNSFTGTYTLNGNKLSFSQVAATMEMCLEEMEIEQLFHSVLGETTGYKPAGDTLKLIDRSGAESASFKAIYLQ